MKILKAFFGCLATTSSIWLLCGCSTSRSDTSNANQLNTETGLTNTGAGSMKRNESGTEQIFTNANVVMWVPSDAAKVWDGPTSVVKVDKFTPPHTRPEGYKITVEIEIDSEQEFKRNAELSQDWYFQEHPTLSTEDGQVGKQFRKDIRDPEKGCILLINGMVEKSETFSNDVDTARKMIESIKLIPK